jgi:hypothetical protein
VSNFLIPGALIALLVLVNIPKSFYVAIFSFFAKNKNPKIVKDLDVEDVKSDPNVTYEIHEIVKQWSILRNMLMSEKLDLAVKTLDDVFLKLLNKSEGEAHEENS